MDLLQALFTQALNSGSVEVSFHGGEQRIAEVMENICFQTLENIKNIVCADNLSDPECFEKIEEIVCTFEEIGVYCGGRHDFG